MHCFKFDVYVVIHNLVYYIKFGIASATHYHNCSLLCILLLDVFCSTIWKSVEYKLLLAVAILYCILTTRYHISYDFHEVLLIKLSIYNYHSYTQYNCKKFCWLFQLLLSLKNFLWDITYNIDCGWRLAILYRNG